MGFMVIFSHLVGISNVTLVLSLIVPFPIKSETHSRPEHGGPHPTSTAENEITCEKRSIWRHVARHLVQTRAGYPTSVFPSSPLVSPPHT